MENEIEKTHKIAIFHTAKSKICIFLISKKKTKSIYMFDRNLDWNELRKQTNLSDFSIIFLDGGNSPKIKGIDLLGNDVADYVDNGGIVCTLGASNIRGCIYTIKGRWKNEDYQPVKGFNLFFFHQNNKKILNSAAKLRLKDKRNSILESFKI